jgi:hypothetical protein
MTRYLIDAPAPSEFLEFFGVEPIEARPEDRYWCYEFRDKRNFVLRFSFDAVERSVQTLIRNADAVLWVCSHEGANRIWFSEEKGGKVIRAVYRYGDADGELVAQITPLIHVDLSVLMKRG